MAAYALCLLPIAYVFVVAFPGTYIAPNRGLDESWMYALNYYLNSDILIGRDVVYTYGPLGFLLWPMPSGHNIGVAGLFAIATHGLFIGLVGYHAVHQASAARSLVFAVAYTIALMAAFQHEYQLLILVGLLLTTALDERRARVPCLLAAGVLSAILLFTKLGTGAMAAVLIVGYGGVAAHGGLGRAVSGLAIVGTAYGASALALAVMYVQSFAGLARWVSVYREISGGYDTAMTLEFPEYFIQFEVAALVAYLAATAALVYRRSEVARLACIFALPMMLSFKHGSVRGPYLFLSFCLATLGVIIIRSYSSRDLKVSVAAFLVVLMVALPVVTNEKLALLRGANEVVTGGRGWASMLFLRHYNTSVQRLRDSGALALQIDRLPPAWVTPMTEANAGVDVLPWELAYIPANGLRWTPNPVLQGFVAYTPGLDRLSADHFSSGRAPDYLLVDWTNTDAQHPMTGSPATWRAILGAYEVARLAPAGQPIGLGAGFLQLKRRADAAPHELSVLEAADIEPAGATRVPNADGALFANLELELTTLGRAVRTVSRVPPVYMNLQFASGRTAGFRVVADTLRDGVLINYLPLSVEEYRDLSVGVASDRVTVFSLSGPGLAYYRTPARVTWMVSARPVRYLGP